MEGASLSAATVREGELRAGFEQFIAAAQSLEASYRALKSRADAVDLQLAATNRELQRTLAEREAVFRALPVGVTAIDAEGRAIWTNPEAERLLALARRGGLDLRSLSDGEWGTGECTVRLRRVAAPGGELLVLEDRSHVVRLEREVDRLDRLAGLSELALGVAHEIKNPLNGVMGFAALLQRAEDPKTAARHAQRIVEGLAQVDGIVKALLAFARPAGRTGERAPLLHALTRAAAAAGLPAARLDCSGAMDAPVDATALTTVLTNLFRNSVEAAGGDVHIVAQAERTPGELVLRVSDDGPGVPAEVGARAFEPFVSTKERGHGLGLPLCARVMSYLRGRIDLENPGDRGARFVLRMPRLPEGAA
ncbi:MAG: hypothetical protein IT458_18520 [Planctomycetes bacterium]|nr:hypothetical protein [Planctomycetota bacterium]